MYQTVLLLHSWVRWFVILFGMIAVVRAFRVKRGRWSAADDRAGMLFTVALDVQFLLGLLLYVALSPLTAAAFRNFGAAMQNATLRYWAVEHVAGMVLAIIAAHVGRRLVTKAAPDRKARKAATFYTIALLLILASIPWPGSANARPLLRMP